MTNNDDTVFECRGCGDEIKYEPLDDRNLCDGCRDDEDEDGGRGYSWE